QLQKAKRRAMPLWRLQQSMHRAPVRIVVRVPMIATRIVAITAAVRRATPATLASRAETRRAKAAATARVTVAAQIVAPIAVAVPETGDAVKIFAVSQRLLHPRRRSALGQTRIRRSRNSRL
ncbi:MAG: hypothetical protein Q8N51_13495, partial [Gammaproteobacteria bacterium]|nr:hypothetical protein [Gammaproteobacteria bacterium]